jgi:hypothetical protein
MADESSFSVRKRDGKVEPFKRGILKEDLVSGFRLAPEEADVFVRSLELGVLRRKKDVVESAAIKQLVYDYKVTGPVDLAVARLAEAEFGEIAPPPTEEVIRGPRREYTRRGPAAPVLLAADSLAALVEPAAEPLARLLRHTGDLAAAFLNEAVREEIDELVDVLDPMSFVNADRKAALRRAIEAVTADRFVRPAQRAAFLEALTEVGERADLVGAEGLATAIYDAVVTNLRRRGVTVTLDDDLAAGEVYRMVASLERRGNDKPLRGFDWPLYAYERVDPLADDLDGGELTFQGRNERSLYTDDVTFVREFVSSGWLPATEFPNDLPRPYRKNLEGADTVGVYAWFLVERETTDSILDELFEKAGDALRDKEEELAEKAESKFGDFLGDLSTAIPFPVPDSVKKAAGQLAGGVVGWLIDLIVELLNTEARPFPSVQIVHRVLWPAGKKPLSLVAMSTRGTAEDEYRQARFAYYRENEPNRISPYSDDLQGTVIWFGASQPAPEAPGGIFRATAESRETAIIWRPTDGVLAPCGFGATVRQQNVVKREAVFVPMLRSDLRKDKVSASVSGTGVVTGN